MEIIWTLCLVAAVGAIVVAVWQNYQDNKPCPKHPDSLRFLDGGCYGCFFQKKSLSRIERLEALKNKKLDWYLDATWVQKSAARALDKLNAAIKTTESEPESLRVTALPGRQSRQEARESEAKPYLQSLPQLIDYLVAYCGQAGKQPLVQALLELQSELAKHSNCHNAPVRTEPQDELDEPDGKTFYYVCTDCGNLCDTH